MTDIIAGAIIGLLVAIFVNFSIIQNSISKPIYTYSKKHPQGFYICFFILSYQTATNFDDFRKITNFISNILLLVK